MRTSKPISTISYNTSSFLRGKIQEWKNCGFIDYAMWIKHQPDEDNKKEHYHVYIKPSKVVQTTFFEEDSKELDPAFQEYEWDDNLTDEENIRLCEKNESKRFFKMIAFRSSKEGDWLLYGIHDKAYLQEKGLKRNIHYAFDDIESTCSETLQDIISHMSDERKGRLEYRIIECVNLGMGWRQIVRSGIIPLRQMVGAKHFYSAITGQVNDIE